jgi:hypothetical protein
VYLDVQFDRRIRQHVTCPKKSRRRDVVRNDSLSVKTRFTFVIQRKFKAEALFYLFIFSPKKGNIICEVEFLFFANNNRLKVIYVLKKKKSKNNKK